MKIIFLDIDGVLNHDDWYVSPEFSALSTADDVELDVDPKCTQRLIEICEKCDAKIVISSSWRINMYSAAKRLERGGLPIELVIDGTPDFTFLCIKNIDISRGDEIAIYLEKHPEISNYVIIDDAVNFHENQLQHFVHINAKHGLTEEKKQEAINILNH